MNDVFGRNKLAFVVATKDRPDDLRTMLTSLASQSPVPDQIVIVDSSAEPVEAVAAEFESLNIKYMHHLPPSAAGQRNAGIKAVDSDIHLVGFLDDDVVLEPGAMDGMHRFWNQAGPDVGGCAFNWMNFEAPGGQWLKRSRLCRWLGLYADRRGCVMPSGWATLIGIVDETAYSQWLPSGASVWRKSILDAKAFDEYFFGYSYLEDLDFSYSVSRDYKLAVVADAGFCHYPSPSGRIGLYSFGKIEVRNRLYIVRKHGLSVPRCYLAILVRLLMTLGAAVKGLDKPMFQRALGNVAGIGRSLLPTRAKRGNA